MLERCARASNCEVYHTERGDILRFKRGTEPGTEAFNQTFADELALSAAAKDSEHLPFNLTADASLTARNTDPAKRQINWQTEFSSGKWRTDFGALNPWDAFVKIWDMCQERSCYTGRYQVGTSFLYGMAWTNVNLDLYAHGEYPGWDARNKFAELIMAACQKNQNWWQARGCLPSRVGVCTEARWVCNAPNYYSASRWGPNGEFGGYMNIVVENNSNGGYNSCAGVVDQLNSLLGAINGWGGYFFGALKMVCPDN
jgi:hypothetical protein